MKAVPGVVIALLAFGCGEQTHEDASCAWLDSELGAEGDVVVPLSRESTVALGNAGRNPALIRVQDGELVFRPGGPGDHELAVLKVVFSGFSLGEIDVADHGLLIEGPLADEDQAGQGLDLTGASGIEACANFDGELQRATRTELGFGHVEIDDAAQTVSLALTYEAEFEFDEPPPVADLFTGGKRVRLTGDLSAGGKEPWIQR